MDCGHTRYILHCYLVVDMVLEIFSSLEPAVTKALITGLATSLAKVAAESGLKLFGQGSEKLLDGAGNVTQQAIDLLIPIAHKYFENYANRHGQFKILGMNRPLSIESVYTQVNFHPEAIQAHQSLDTIEAAFRGRASRNDDRRAGMEVANTHQYLMILGGPGTGKTTFLRKVGLEAIKNNHGEYAHASIPVFLELRSFQWKATENIDLEAKIAAEFEHCGLSESIELTRKLLERGKLLILFDGLDEVPPEFMRQITTAIKNLVDRYDKNRFIASCRIAAYRHFQNFNRFTDVAIDDFEEVQIKEFINNWFRSHDQSERGNKCWSILTSDAHKPTMELAKTPLLLTLICISFFQNGEIPTKRSTLYENAVLALLSGWDSSKQIDRQQRYKSLDRKGKEELLSEIAYTNFIDNNLFFQQGEVSQQIEQVLREILTDEQRIDGLDVLKSVEEQHGILINRYEDTYSFSHLTLQEFLTAKYIFDHNLSLTDLVTQHLCNKRWREVFLLLAGLRKADDLLLTMEQQIRTYLNTSRLQQLLVWVDKVSNPTSGDFQSLGKRAIAISIANANAYNNINAYFYAYTNTNAYAYANAYAANTNTNVYAYVSVVANPTATAIKYFVQYAEWTKYFEIYQGLDLQSAIDRSEQLKTEIPDDSQPIEVRRAFRRKLIELWLTAFQLTPEMVDLSKLEIQALENYLYGHLLLVECERAAVRRTPEVWSQIESRMLRLP